MRVMVLGAAGQLAAAILHEFQGCDIIAHTRATLDITEPRAVSQAVCDGRPDVVINCAAFNDVDGAEERPAEAFAVNALAVRNLAGAAEEQGAVLVHYSTDFVFDGDASVPYVEVAAPSPRSAYAMSKLTGEWFALQAPGAFVLRVESLFGTPLQWTGRRGTLDGIVAGLEAGRPVRAFTDRVVSPSYIVDTAAATRHLIESSAAPGLYHCVNTGSATWYQVAEVTAGLLHVRPELVPVTMDTVTLKARRPRFCALDNGKLVATGFEMPTWQEAVKRWLTGRRSGASIQ